MLKLQRARASRALADTRKVMPFIICSDYPNQYNGGPLVPLAKVTDEAAEKHRRQQELLDDAEIVHHCVRVLELLRLSPRTDFEKWIVDLEKAILQEEKMQNEVYNPLSVIADYYIPHVTAEDYAEWAEKNLIENEVFNEEVNNAKS